MATRSLGSLTLDLVAKTGGFEQGMDRAARSMQRFKAETSKQQNDLEKLLGKIDPVVGRLGELDKMEQQLAAHRKANRLPADDYAEYLGKLNAMRDGLTKATSANDKYTMSAKAQAAALRGVPAQFTDIVTSLQGGQQPLTVFLQQGGQLKDMFGGAAPAARALGGYVLGLINPFTLAAAAAAALALAYYQGSKEQDAFRVSLVTTGNLAGKNTGQMADLAKEVSGVTGTTGAAAEALAQLVATGSLTSDQFKDMAVAAVAWESATGKAVSDTVAEFKRLADEPTKASAALNEQYNYLTAAVYDQIRALEEQGNKTAAANLAEATYAGALQERAKNIKENLGALESAWNSLTSGAKKAWDAMLNIGREDTLAQQIEKVQKQLDELPARSSVTGRQASRDQAAQDAQRAALQGQLDFLKQQKATQDSIARAQGLAADDERAAIAASTSMHQKYLAGLDKEAQKKNAIAELDRERAARLRVAGADAAAIQREYAVALAGIEDKFKDKSTTRTKAYSDDEATRTLLALRQQQSSLEEQLASSEKLTASQQKLAQFEQQIADLKTKQTLTADQQSLLANQSQIKAQLQKNAAIEQEIVHKQELQKLTERAAQLDASIASTLASQAEQYGRQLDGAGMGDQYRDRLNQQKSIYREFQRYQEQLDKATPKDLLGSDQYNEATEKIRAGQEKALKQSADYYAELDRQNSDWTLGAQDAYQNYLASARDVAGQTKSLFTNAFSSMEDAIVSFALTGKLSFSDFAKSVLADMAKIAVRSASSQALSGLLSIAGSVAASYFGAGGTAPASTSATVGGSTTTFNPQLNTAGLTYNAKGGVYDSPSLSAFSNQVHDTPKLFAFAKGAGIFAEAGPEAVMPLTRAADGSLGVRALQGQNNLPAAAPIQIHTEVHVDAGGNATASTDASQAGAAGQQLGKMISDGALRVVQQQLATGGSIWRLVNGR
ncbi:phage tail tape measure protein [uncultured Pseudomonas sp.]|uniref:phage tail tape measure protein n=1 Tax=uncultured Pseudomonas sp. TaxID=114707 RepID=UPI0025E1EE8E|nr:phage tail tape measure protein [uncultured Pseudomonas sp.]